MAAANDSWLRKKSERDAIKNMEEKISDPELRKKLIPEYPMGAKRILFSDDYYEAVARDNVDVITDSVQRITENGVDAKSGTHYDADVLIYATGFDSTTFLTPMQVHGRDDRSLNDLWDKEGAEAYLGITHSGFPNFFMMYGPNTNLGHNSIVVMIEAQTRYILSCLDALESKQAAWLDVKGDVQQKYNTWIQQRMTEKVWTVIDKSWYKRDGKVTNNWVGRTTEYRKRTRKMNPDDYEFV
ncbi:MAG: hypothetical protein COA73_09870 [Candidatus Hydrogenedentota bacterium]|nr:MAG: hypothetical protein COA73_09870 [Candidatus Hydrogenedentota bacterium]